MGYGPITHFTEIEAWKLARKPRVAVYSVIKELPTEERYDLASQMRRAAISCSANIAEGYGRFHYQENIQFCRISRGSMYETQDHLITCIDNQYISKELYDKIWELSMNAIKVLDGYIRYLKKKVTQ
ncbi:MAG: four helix bundle protein [Desulfobacteraceae bacterium]|nr:four helix bundle protein [Pseudomonadota bacterium]MCG2758774.1 four helix bundle protein [Desulfobacteraceae bacterium]MCG2830657.1 four helix bundle protein [Desulfobacteraceae bacterium]